MGTPAKPSAAGLLGRGEQEKALTLLCARGSHNLPAVRAVFGDRS